MKHAKRLLSMALALVIALALSIPALAVTGTNSDNGSITIDNAVVGQKYTIYQILTLESYDTEAEAYAYKVASAWTDFVNSTDIKGVYLNVDDQGYVSWVEGADAAAFAKLAQAKAKTMTADGEETAPTAAEGATYSTVTFSDLKLGYYLVDTTLGTLCSLDTTNPTAVMQEKNEVPENTKTVEEDSDNKYGAANDADIGQSVNFKSTITARPGAENYVLHDEMSAGLSFTGVTSVTLDGAAVDASNYTVTSEPEDGCTFEVAFTQAFLDSLEFSDSVTSHTIVVYYSATVNENAVIGSEGNKNESYLSYGDETNIKSTPPSPTTTCTWKLKVFKYTGTDTALAGAKFELRKIVDGNEETIALIAKGNNVYRVAKSDESSETTGYCTEITTDATGKFEIEGLDADTYYLVETVAPAGYNKLKGPVKVEVASDGKLTYWTYNGKGDNNVDQWTKVDEKVDEVKVLNQTGVELPSTGGAGTTAIYVVGAVLALGALVLLVTRRRMRKNG